MCEERHLVPQSVLFGKVIAYECTVCGRTSAVSLLYGAVLPGLPLPVNVRDASFHMQREDAAKIKTKLLYAISEFLMALDVSCRQIG
jgi:hypothetical protein